MNKEWHFIEYCFFFFFSSQGMMDKGHSSLVEIKFSNDANNVYFTGKI